MKLLLTTVLLAATGFAHAQSLDAEFSALLRADKHKEAEQLARQRLAANPKDDVALWTLGRLTGGEVAARKELLPKAEACVAERPQSARCHNLIGSLLGIQAQSGGMSEALKLVGRIKEGFIKGAELDPGHYAIRRDLVQFYLQAPGIAGGSVRKAREQAEDFGKKDPARGALLGAEVLIYDKAFDKAEAVLAGIKPGGDADLAEALRGTRSNLGFGLLQDEKATAARRQFEAVIAEDATNANAHLGLGRALLALDQAAAAVPVLERGLQINPKLRAHYRLGMAYEKLGEKAKAIAAFKQFLSYQSEGKAPDDARKRIAALGG
jgi:tetratricopeptide (TPR) repeat protein